MCNVFWPFPESSDDKGRDFGSYSDCKKGSFSIVKEIRLFYGRVNTVAACHAGYKTCYYREYTPKTDSIQIVESKVFEPDNVYK